MTDSYLFYNLYIRIFWPQDVLILNKYKITYPIWYIKPLLSLNESRKYTGWVFSYVCHLPENSICITLYSHVFIYSTPYIYHYLRLPRNRGSPTIMILQPVGSCVKLIIWYFMFFMNVSTCMYVCISMIYIHALFFYIF